MLFSETLKYRNYLRKIYNGVYIYLLLYNIIRSTNNIDTFKTIENTQTNFYFNTFKFSENHLNKYARRKTRFPFGKKYCDTTGQYLKIINKNKLIEKKIFKYTEKN